MARPSARLVDGFAGDVGEVCRHQRQNARRQERDRSSEKSCHVADAGSRAHRVSALAAHAARAQPERAHRGARQHAQDERCDAGSDQPIPLQEHSRREQDERGDDEERPPRQAAQHRKWPAVRTRGSRCRLR